MPRLGVNIDHVATLRQARLSSQPCLAVAALICEQAGADSIVCHLREDRRHIQDRDLYLLKKTVRTRLNLEMSCSDEIVRIACRVKPNQSTLVPERRQELTTEGGLDVAGNLKKIRRVIGTLSGSGIEVSLFIDPDKLQLDAARRAGANMVELHTGRYAEAKSPKEKKKYFQEIKKAAEYGSKIGLAIFAGHGLDYNNSLKIAKIKEIEELNIGYSIILRAVIVGLDRAVRQMKLLVN